MDLKKFNTKEKLTIDPASTILICGSRRSGKTTYAKYLVNYIQVLYSLIIVFTHTKNSYQWNELVDEDDIFDEYYPEIIELIERRNKILMEKCPEINPNALIIFDDIIDDSSIRNDETIKRIFTRGRWSHIGCVFLTQYLNFLSPTIRVNADIIICPIQTSLQSFEILYDSYGIIEKKLFFALINKYTHNHSVFIIRNDKKSNVPEIKYQWDRAKYILN